MIYCIILIMHNITAEKGRPPSMIAMPGLGGINPIELRQKLKPVAAPVC